MRGAWIEIAIAARNYAEAWSLPMRGAWIEISNPCIKPVAPYVAPHAGSVD